MKKIYTVLSLIFLTNIAFASVDENVVRLKYSKPINGLEIEVLWEPKTVRNGYARGPAIIELTNKENGTSSTVVSNYFTVTEERASKFIEWKKEENKDAEVRKILSKTVNLDYSNPKIPAEGYSFGTLEEPFFFYDINFDGKKEFLVSEVEAGQRWRSTFRAYEFDDSDYFLLKEAFQQITYQEPFVSLDDASIINKENKSITIHISAGAIGSENHVYDLRKGIPVLVDYSHEYNQ